MGTDYTLSVDGDVATVQIRIHRCGACRRGMWWRGMGRDVSLGSFANTVTAQAKRAGFVEASDVYVQEEGDDPKKVCVECAAAKKAKFVCACCRKKRPWDSAQESYGDPPEHLCSVCYGSVSASVWDDWCGRLGR